MIGTVHGQVGRPVRLSGYADDFDRAIEAVQFSLDGGKNWTEYPTGGADTERLLRWNFSFTPEVEGDYLMHVRSKNDRGEVSPTPAFVRISVEGRSAQQGERGEYERVCCDH